MQLGGPLLPACLTPDSRPAEIFIKSLCFLLFLCYSYNIEREGGRDCWVRVKGTVKEKGGFAYVRQD